VRLVAVAVCVLASAVGLSACGESTADRIGRYIKDANREQRNSAPAFKRANQAYARFSQRKVQPEAAAREAATAERAIRATRARLAALKPPPEAAELHRRLLGVFDGNAAIAHETVLLTRYLPAAEKAVKPLAGISSRLRRRLADAPTPARQSRALLLYAVSLDRLLAALRKLKPPPILAPTDHAQIVRLTAARSLARRLHIALVAENAKRVAKLLLRFRTLNSRRGQDRLLANRAIRAYNRRYKKIITDEQDMQRERYRLERSL
jgi:hypothetical protein